MTSVTIPPIEGKTTVNVPIEQAFALFTASFTAWWPHQYHIGQADVADVILEPHEGGRWYERGVDGTEMRLGPCPGLGTAAPGAVHLADRRQLAVRPRPHARASEIEVRFRADGPAQTTVEVEYGHFERLVGGEGVHGAIRSGGGCPALLDS